MSVLEELQSLEIGVEIAGREESVLRKIAEWCNNESGRDDHKSKVAAAALLDSVLCRMAQLNKDQVAMLKGVAMLLIEKKVLPVLAKDRIRQLVLHLKRDHDKMRIDPSHSHEGDLSLMRVTKEESVTAKHRKAMVLAYEKVATIVAEEFDAPTYIFGGSSNGFATRLSDIDLVAFMDPDQLTEFSSVQKSCTVPNPFPKDFDDKGFEFDKKVHRARRVARFPTDRRRSSILFRETAHADADDLQGMASVENDLLRRLTERHCPRPHRHHAEPMERPREEIEGYVEEPPEDDQVEHSCQPPTEMTEIVKNAGVYCGRVIAKKLQEDECVTHLVCIENALVPIVKFTLSIQDIDIEVDLSFNHEIVLHNTRLLRDYAEMEPLVRNVGILVKHWAKQKDICSSYKNTLSGYAWLLMVIHFFQRYLVPGRGGGPKLPVLPNLQVVGHHWGHAPLDAQVVVEDKYGADFYRPSIGWNDGVRIEKPSVRASRLKGRKGEPLYPRTIEELLDVSLKAYAEAMFSPPHHQIGGDQRYVDMLRSKSKSVITDSGEPFVNGDYSLAVTLYRFFDYYVTEFNHYSRVVIVDNSKPVRTKQIENRKNENEALFIEIQDPMEPTRILCPKSFCGQAQICQEMLKAHAHLKKALMSASWRGLGELFKSEEKDPMKVYAEVDHRVYKKTDRPMNNMGRADRSMTNMSHKGKKGRSTPKWQKTDK